jgi:glutathione synthase
MKRVTLAEMNAHGTLDGTNRNLIIHGEEVAVVYYRAGYAPTDYPSDIVNETPLSQNFVLPL